jgi:hypothetical protein
MPSASVTGVLGSAKLPARFAAPPARSAGVLIWTLMAAAAGHCDDGACLAFRFIVYTSIELKSAPARILLQRHAMLDADQDILDLAIT